MGGRCPICEGLPGVGALCEGCADGLPVCEGLMPEHLRCRWAATSAAAWLVDRFGGAHPLRDRTTVGRRPDADLVVSNVSVSRDHAEIGRGASGWQVRDLGSRNWTQIDGERVQGRAALADRATVRFGSVAFYFVGRAIELPTAAGYSIETAHAADSGTFRYTLHHDAVELCVLGSLAAGDAEGGAVLHRRRGDVSWHELSLPPLEFHLLRVLCARAVEHADSPSRSSGCVATKQLARLLPFQSRYANEENVRQVVRRVRATLTSAGIAGLVEALPGRGYYLAWEVHAP
jgi:hypothetical protein